MAILKLVGTDNFTKEVAPPLFINTDHVSALVPDATLPNEITHVVLIGGESLEVRMSSQALSDLCWGGCFVAPGSDTDPNLN